MATKKKPAKKARTAKKRTAKKRTVRFEGTQAMIPGVAPKKATPGGTFTTRNAEGAKVTIAVPKLDIEERANWRRRPSGSSFEGRTFTARMEVRTTPEQLNAWKTASTIDRKAIGSWLRDLADERVAQLAKERAK